MLALQPEDFLSGYRWTLQLLQNELPTVGVLSSVQ